MKNLLHLFSGIERSFSRASITTTASQCSFAGAPLFRSIISAVLLAVLLGGSAGAFPPAPHHLIYGTVRDEMGNPLWLEGAAVILETPSGVLIKGEISPGLEPGVNYKIAVPLDSGVTSDAYRSGALRTTMPFKLRVEVRRSIYLPIEMSGDFSRLGRAAESTRLDLTLGEDSNGNGLPDAWERALIAASGGELDQINPNDDLDKDGLSNLQEYLAGTFAFDQSDGFSLKVIEMKPEGCLMEFMTIRGRTYSVYASADMKNWEVVSFRVTAAGAVLSDQQKYQAIDSQVVRGWVSPSSTDPGLRFFKLRVE